MSYHRYFKWSTPGADGIVAGRYCCPCCGYPALKSWSEFEICRVCWWEDDGSGDRTADHVAGGPNGSYALSEARANFEDHGDMYRYDATRIGVVSKPSRERLALLQYIGSLRAETGLDCEMFFHLLDAAA
jgi:hypothetical protein